MGWLGCQRYPRYAQLSVSQGQVPLLPLAPEKSRSPINQLSNGNDNGATPSTSSGIEQGPPAHGWRTRRQHLLGIPRPAPPSSQKALPEPRGRQCPPQKARRRPPPSLGFPPGTERGERRPQPDQSCSARPRSRPFLPSSGGLTMAATQLRGPGGLTSWPRGPGSRAAGGSKVKGVCEERMRRACALLQRAGRGRKPKVCGRVFGRGLRPPPALGNLRRFRTT